MASITHALPLRSVGKNAVRSLFGSQLRRNMLSGTIASSIGCILMLIAYPAYLKSLGYQLYGIWLLLNTITTFAQLGNLGIAPALSRQVSEEVGANNMGAVTSCITTALTAIICIGLVIILFFSFGCRSLLVVFRLHSSQITSVTPLLPWIGVVSACAMMAEVISAASCGLGRMDLYNYAQCATQGVGVSLSILLLRSGLGLNSLLIGNAVATICLAALGVLMTRHLTRSLFISFRSFSLKRLRALISYGSGLASNSIFTLLFSPFNRLVIARYAGVSSVPVYDIAFSSCMRLRNIFESGQRALIPEIGRVAGTSPAAAYARAIKLGSRIVRAFAWVLPVYVSAFVSAAPALKFWLGSRYDPELALATRIILVGTFFSLVGTPGFYILAALGRLRTLLVGNIIQSVSNIVLIGIYLFLFHNLSVSVVLSVTTIAMLCSTIFLVVQSSRVKLVLPRS
ncbi:MAG: oligosaccharide flippase family protein [Bryobacteraceae bacterium]